MSKPQWNSSFAHDNPLDTYSALRDRHCLYTKGEGFRRYFEKVVGPLSVQALSMVKPNMDLDYSKLSTRRNLKLITRPSSAAAAGHRKPRPVLSKVKFGHSKTKGPQKRARPGTAPSTRGGFSPLPRQGYVGKPLDLKLDNRDVEEFILKEKVRQGTTARHEKEKITRKMKHLLLYLEGRKSILGSYLISKHNETLGDLRNFIKSNLDYWWSKSFVFSWRDGVEIDEGSETRVLLNDFVNVKPKSSGVIIVPVHSARNQRRLLKQTRRKSRASTDNRVAKKLNEAKKMDVVSGGYTEALSPGKGDMGDSTNVMAVNSAGSEISKNKDHGDQGFVPGSSFDDGVFDKTTGSLTSSAVKKYEQSKELIAVSYLASVERSRKRGRAELKRILEEAALRIQCMWRAAKAKGHVEEILLKLQAAAILQGIVRRDQSKAVFARKKEEQRVRNNKEIKARKVGELGNKRFSLKTKEPKRRERPAYTSGRKIKVVHESIVDDVGRAKVEQRSAVISMYQSRKGQNINCYRVKLVDIRSHMTVESEIELKGEGFVSVQTGLDKQSDDEFFSKVCEKLVLKKKQREDDRVEEDGEQGGGDDVIFDATGFYDKLKITSRAIRLSRSSKCIIEVVGEQGLVVVESSNLQSGDCQQVVLSPRHLEAIPDPSLSLPSELRDFGESVIKHIHYEEGKLHVDFDLNMKEVVLFAQGVRMKGGGNKKRHVVLKRRGDSLKVEVMDNAYQAPLTCFLADWSCTGYGELKGLKKEELYKLLKMIVSRIFIMEGEEDLVDGYVIPKIIVDLEANFEPLLIVSQAVILMGEKFLANVFKIGEALKVEAQGMNRSTHAFELEVAEEDWAKSDYGNLRDMMGKKGERESRLTELSRRILENMFVEREDGGGLHLSLDKDMMHRKCLLRTGFDLDGERKRCMVFDTDRLSKEDVGSQTVLQVVVDDLGEEGGYAADKIKLDVEAKDWCVGIKGRRGGNARRRLGSPMSEDTVQSILDGKRFRDLDVETQNEVLDYIMDNLAVDKKTGEVKIEYARQELLFFYENDIHVGGKTFDSLKMFREGDDIFIQLKGREEWGEEVKTKLKDDQSKEVIKMIDDENHTVDGETITSNIYYDMKENKVELDFRKKRTSIYETKVEGIRNGKIVVTISQLGDELIVELKDTSVGNTGGGTSARRLVKDGWLNTGYGSLNSLRMEDIEALCKIVASTLKRNAFTDKHGNPKQLVDWEGWSEETDMAVVHKGDKTHKDEKLFGEIINSCKRKKTLFVKNKTGLMSSSELYGLGTKIRRQTSAVKAFNV
eukprot:CAMPEP_0118636644 /NCGR_PEP_ID=MMETSP0785-20121206/2736_1 /TAXON_ID=91992 /ORGANISM="Bolidomonas pacifica, Strain CCMP 1866" /LENGTH=1292 /DNA_ID=CAMNT_0006527791 /DNA_START=178 /DNA_END=4053 /DNA_ORIENTATION=-